MASANTDVGTGTSPTAANNPDTVRDNALQSMQHMCKKIMSTLATPLGKDGDPSTGQSCARMFGHVQSYIPSKDCSKFCQLVVDSLAHHY